MNVGHVNHTATWLGGINQILILGGVDLTHNEVVTGAAELFDPTTNRFTQIANLAIPRYAHTATKLGLNVVLIVGGYDTHKNRVVVAELFDPLNQTFSVSSGRMTSGRAEHSAALLTSGPLTGQVVLVGGGPVTPDAEVYDPTTDSFTAVPAIQSEFGLVGQRATALP
jgi:hypothetical protein